MGHYDEQIDYEEYETNLKRDRYLIKEIKKNKYNVLVDAAHMVKCPTVSIDVQTFTKMLNIIRRLDADTYSYPWK